MPEHIDYDDDPAGTAADAWLKTELGVVTCNNAIHGSKARNMLRRAFRCGYLIGDKAAEKAGQVGRQDDGR